MLAYKKISTNLMSMFWLIAMIGVWLAFAPTQAGGSASYIIIVGKSMEPTFHIGDLVIVHQEANYQIGDAVVYRNLELNNFVFHRIIEESLGHFTLQGDNNSWKDTYHPSYDEVIGKLWLYIPQGGVFFQKIRNPIIMALIAGILGGILIFGSFSKKARGRKHMNTDWFTSVKQKIQGWLSQNNSSQTQQPSSNQDAWLEILFFTLGLVAILSLVFGIISFSRPATRMVKNDISYEQLGFFAYNASAPQSVYDANALKSGDPIFTKLTCGVNMTFQYTLVAEQAQNISGTYQLTATISEQVSGWQRTIPLQSEAAFTGNTVGTTAQLDLCKFEKLTQDMEQGTDFHPGSYLLTIKPNIKINGQLSGRELEATFNTGINMIYDRVHFYLETEDQKGNLLGNPLSINESGVLSEQQTVANTVKVLNAEFAVPALRLISIIGLLGSLFGLFLIVTRFQNLSQKNPAQFIRARFGSTLVDVQNADSLISKTAIDVSSIDDLGKLAERFNTMILHTESGHSHAYYVQGEGTTYRFVISQQETEAAITESEAKS